MLQAKREQDGQNGEAVHLAPWITHDLRRTAATGMAKLNVSPHVATGMPTSMSATLRSMRGDAISGSINGNPWRLDLDWRWHRRGVELGCLFSVNPDAHSIREIDSSLRWGVAMARKGGLGTENVINCRDMDGFAGWLSERRRRLSS